MREQEKNILKYENTAEIGDVIKAFDFQPMPGRGNCYITGKVLDKGIFNQFAAYKVEVTGQMWDGKPTDRQVGEIMYVPFETSMEDRFPGYDNRVTKVEGAA